VRALSDGRRVFALAAGLGVAWLAFYASWLAIRPGGDDALKIFADTAYLVPLAAATGFTLYTWRRVPQSLRSFWGILFAACAAWLVADTAWCVRDLIDGSVPYPWWSDAGYLLSDALMLVAVYVAFRPRARLVGTSRLLDGLIAVGALGLLWWWLLIHPLELTTDLESVVTAAYPVFGLLVIGMVVSTRLLPARQGTLAMRLVAAGVAVSVLTNGLYVYMSLTGGFISGDWIELGWEAQGILFSIAAVCAAKGFGRPNAWMRFRDSRELGSGFIVSAALALALVLLVVDGTNRDISIGLVIGVAALVTLVLARMWVAFSGRSQPDSLTDSRTGAYTADYVADQVTRLAARARHFREPFALALVWIDGPDGAVSTAVERAVATRLAESVREVDVVGSIAHGRYAIALPNVEKDEAAAIAEALRASVAATPVTSDGAPVKQTISVGLSTAGPEDNEGSLVQRAEEALIAARRLGGNQVRSGADDLELFSEAALDGPRLQLFVSLAKLVDDREGPDPAHSQAVAALAAQIALEMGLDGQAVSRSYVAGLLHDLGKLAMPESTLQKPGPLDEAEWDEMTRHASVGAELVGQMAAVRDAAPIVAAHHERWDGTGYPRGLAGERIPPEARIVAVADALISMMSDRPYRSARTETSALTTIWRESGKRYDPAVVSALLALARDGRLKLEEAEPLPSMLLVSPAPAAGGRRAPAGSQPR
jgi:diguanylate cyclase (GGDEF)-like protein/putative nucleotidyltransferase with HDIG domain